MRREPGQLFFLVTQGCKVNQYESQAIRETWIAQGLVETWDPGLADIVLINSCAVTERAILDLAKLVRGFAAICPKPWTVVAGCAVEADPERVQGLPGVDETLTQKGKWDLGDLTSRTGEAPFSAFTISDYNRARAVIKVQDGCSHGCTYCIIPTTRGTSVSRDPGQVIAECRRLLSAGIREFALCGINLRQYGRDLSPRMDFWDLLAGVDRALAPEWAGRARLRIGSLEPADLHAKALASLHASRLMSPHLHISLQSGSTDVLRRMGRGHYDPTDIATFLADLRGHWPVFGLGADLIAGFPGETDSCFQETLELVSRLPLTYAHVFPYSERPGTPAANFKDAVPGHLRRERAKILRQVVEKKRLEFLRHLLTRPCMEVVLEDTSTGMNEFYVECRVEGAENMQSRSLVPVAPLGISPAGLVVRATENTAAL